MGTVALCMNPTGMAQPAVDVAVIECSPGSPSTGFSVSGAISVPAGAKLDFHLSTSITKAITVGYSQWQFFPSTGVTYSDVYLTGTMVTVPGDSGALVCLEGTSRLAGHVLGGSPGACSFVQDGRSQRRAIHAIPGFRSLALI